jgi:hypothetical protein
VGNNIERIRKEFFDTLNKNRQPERPEFWDGKTAERCLTAILNYSKLPPKHKIMIIGISQQVLVIVDTFCRI